MNSLGKHIVILATIVVMLLVGVTNVSAVAFESIMSDIMTDNGYTINAGDELTFGSEVWIGESGRMNIISGSANLKLDAQTGIISISVADGSEVIINEGKQFIMQLEFDPGTGTTIYPVELTIGEDATFNIDGNLAIPSGSEGVLINNGTLNINGRMEVRRDGIYDSLNGVTNLKGILAIYGDATTTNIGEAKINLYAEANIYSEDDISSNIVIAETENENYTWTVTENTKTYTSFSTNITDTEFAYGYTLLGEEINQPTTDEPSTDTTNPTETIENPSTNDNVMMYIILGIIATLGVAGTIIYFKKSKN